MSFKIGFTTDPPATPTPKTTASHQDTPVKPSVVTVTFPEHGVSYPYYNDLFTLSCGDMVFVEGKMAGVQGRVTKVFYSFKIKPSEYRRVIGLADTQVIGEFHFAGDCILTTDPGALNYSQVATWFYPPADKEDFLCGVGEELFSLDCLNEIKMPPNILDRGFDYYARGRVAYIELDHGTGLAIVVGTKPYELEFRYADRMVSGLVCDCFCTDLCKHEVALLLQLKETLDGIATQYPFIDANDYVAVMSKGVFYEHVMEQQHTGTFILG